MAVKVLNISLLLLLVNASLDLVEMVNVEMVNAEMIPLCSPCLLIITLLEVEKGEQKVLLALEVYHQVSFSSFC